MKKTHNYLIALLFLLLIIVSVIKVFNADTKNRKTYPIPMENNIVLVQRYVNYAWGKQDHGTFVDMRGNVYSFDVSDQMFQSNEDFLHALERIQADGNIASTIAQSTIEDIYIDGMNMNPDADFDTQSQMCDAGEFIVYFYNNETKQLIKLSEKGDWTGARKDSYAQSILKICRKTKIFE